MSKNERRRINTTLHDIYTPHDCLRSKLSEERAQNNTANRDLLDIGFSGSPEKSALENGPKIDQKGQFA